MVLLVKIQESAIVENLKKRYLDDLIYVSLLLCVCMGNMVETASCGKEPVIYSCLGFGENITVQLQVLCKR